MVYTSSTFSSSGLLNPLRPPTWTSCEQCPSVRGVLGLREQTQHGNLLHHGGAPGRGLRPRRARGSAQRWRSRLERAVHRVLRVPLPESVKNKYSIYCDLNVHLRFNIVRLAI